MLRNFSSAVARLALGLEGTHAALEKVKEVGGIELAVEAAAVAGGFEMMTKVVDATGRKPPPMHVQRVFQMVLFVAKHRVAIGMVGASVMSAIALSIFVNA